MPATDGVVGELSWERGQQAIRDREPEWHRLFACYELYCCDDRTHTDRPHTGRRDRLGMFTEPAPTCRRCGRMMRYGGRHWHLAAKTRGGL